MSEKTLIANDAGDDKVRMSVQEEDVPGFFKLSRTTFRGKDKMTTSMYLKSKNELIDLRRAIDATLDDLDDREGICRCRLPKKLPS